jgi:hypothetical protein
MCTTPYYTVGTYPQIKILTLFWRRIMEGAAKRTSEGEATEARETRKKAKVDYNEDRIAAAKKQVREIRTVL